MLFAAGLGPRRIGGANYNTTFEKYQILLTNQATKQAEIFITSKISHTSITRS
jgi:hypothetical protein